MGGDDVPVAVRSSATGEDGRGSSFAGLHGTRPWVTGVDAVLAELRGCWAGLSALVAAALAVERQHGAPQDIAWALAEPGGLFLLQSRPETV